MRCFLMGAAAWVLTLSVSSAALACKDHESAPRPVQQYAPQPEPAQLTSSTEGLRMAGAGLGSAVLAGTIAWSLARRKA